MKSRWIIYVLIGAAFGVLDYVYLEWLYTLHGGILVFVVLNLGVWLLPAVPVALYEAREAQHWLLPAVASMAAWCTAIVTYYLTNAAQLAFLGVPGMEHLHISSRNTRHYWENWGSVLQGSILGGILEWMPVAIVGGAVVGLLTSAAYLGYARKSERHPAEA